MPWSSRFTPVTTSIIRSHGAEPMIFNSDKGSGPRSLILLRNFLDTVALGDEGRLLDIGCANGNLLKSFHSLRPSWKLSGSELLDTWREAVLSLPGVEHFYQRARRLLREAVRRHFAFARSRACAGSDRLSEGDLPDISVSAAVSCWPRRTSGKTRLISSSPIIAPTSTSIACAYVAERGGIGRRASVRQPAPQGARRRSGGVAGARRR